MVVVLVVGGWERVEGEVWMEGDVVSEVEEEAEVEFVLEVCVYLEWGCCWAQVTLFLYG